MHDVKTVNQWLRHFGYQWVEGQEQMYKEEMNQAQAEDFIRDLQAQGVISRG